MKLRFAFFWFLGLVGVCNTFAQTALYNLGNLRIHENGQMGFHTHLINDGVFDDNLGLVGFYGDLPLAVSGAFAPTLFDVEISNTSGVGLDTGINTLNNTNFIRGDFFTPKDRPAVYYNFVQNAFYVGDGDLSKVNGYAAITDQRNFRFPVGDTAQLRPLILNSEGINSLAKCAYFREDPNNPTTFGTAFDTENRPPTMAGISTREFWRLEGSVPASIEISWNSQSDMAALTEDVNTILPVGWSKAANQWVSLGSSGALGTLDNGFTTSGSFVPDEYEIITFGALGGPIEPLDLGNYLVTPNGDGINDTLEIPELEQSPNNRVRIFDRFGAKVFEKSNYTNEFDGLATSGSFVVSQEKGLPSGVYFYIATLHDLDLEFQGFLYLSVRE